MELFASLPRNACDWYRALYDPQSRDQLEVRRHCEDLWRDFEQYADEHFVSQFSVSPHERWFEMYLTVSLLRADLRIECRKPGPDILLHRGGRRIWIEAICATKGKYGLPDSVPDRQFAGPNEKVEFFDVPKQEYALRIQAALSEKARAYSNYLDDGVVNPQDLLAVAINVSRVSWLWADMDDHMCRALYGVGDLMIAIDRETREVVDRRFQKIAHIAKKSTGNLVGVRSFIDGSRPHIAAVIGSRASLGNVPPKLGNDLVIYPNLSADNQWPPEVLRLGEELIFNPNGTNSWTGEKAKYY